jgi:hypothetical protein
MVMSARQVLDREFLPLRAKLLELAAILDRIDRGEGDVADDSRRERIAAALAILESDQCNRAERLQLLFSLPYDAHWREKLLAAGSQRDTD